MKWQTKSDNEAWTRATETVSFSQQSSAEEVTESEQLLNSSHYYFSLLCSPVVQIFKQINSLFFLDLFQVGFQRLL